MMPSGSVSGSVAESVVESAAHSTVEEVVLLSPDGHPIGTAPKAQVHGTDTPLHLAFSSYVFDPGRNLLVTRRALSKRTWPGVWTNSCCGHPGPGERSSDAVARRLDLELGITALDVRVVLPEFRYRAVMDNGIVEGVEPRPDPDEVEEVRWMPWEAFAGSVLSGEFEVSPWCRLQVQQLVRLGADPLDW